MRSILFPILFFFMLGLIMVSPYVGVMIWAWVSMMNAHQLAGGWISTFPLNTVAVALLVASLIVHREAPIPPPNALMILFIIFTLWCIITTITALSPGITTARADLSFKNMLFCIIVAATTTNRLRVRALVWVLVLSYGYFGVKGGAFTLLTGGAGDVLGPPKTSIADRNTLALVMLMTIPLANYLRETAQSRLVRIGLIFLMLLTAVAVLGTFSRGGLIGLAFLGIYFFWTSRHKAATAIGVVIIALAAGSVLPERWFDRMSTVETASSDVSFQNRVDAWNFAMNAAAARVTGVGFAGSEDGAIFRRYMPNPEVPVDHGWSAHSIYFQVLGDHGYIGLGLFAAILVTAWITAGRLTRTTGEGSEWIAPFGKAVRVSLIAYCVAGAALSMAYDASICCLLGLVSTVARQAAVAAPKRSRHAQRAQSSPVTRSARSSALPDPPGTQAAYDGRRTP